MRELSFDDKFMPSECDEGETHDHEGVSSVTVGAGVTWVDVYLAATERDLVCKLKHS